MFHEGKEYDLLITVHNAIICGTQEIFNDYFWMNE